jgi:hypothetical protein
MSVSLWGAAQEAIGLSDVLAAASQSGALACRSPHEGVMAAVAASRAAEANARIRCGRCEACLATQGASRRCLVNRAAAAAAAGHSGAQVCLLTAISCSSQATVSTCQTSIVWT